MHCLNIFLHAEAARRVLVFLLLRVAGTILQNPFLLGVASVRTQRHLLSR